jgi:hypothetical protein
MPKFLVTLGVLAMFAFSTGAAVSKPVSSGTVASVCADNPTKASGGGHMGCTACSHYGCTDYDCDLKTGKCKSESLQAKVKRGGAKPTGSTVPISGINKQQTMKGPSGGNSGTAPGGSDQQHVGSGGHK